MSSENTQSIIAQAGVGDEAPEAIQANPLSSMVPLVLIFVVFYFLLIRPQEKKRKEQEKLVSTVKNGEKVLTNTGIYGKVTKVNENDNTVMVEVAKGVEVKMMRSSIADILERKEAKTSDTKKVDPKKSTAGITGAKAKKTKKKA